MSAPSRRPRPPCIALDFDGTLICEHVLVAWVLFLVRRSGWPALRRLSFLAESIVRGAAAIAFSRWPACAPWAVRAAFAVFRGVEEKSVAALVDCRRTQRRGEPVQLLNLNPAVTAMIGEMLPLCRKPPEIRIYSQGSSREVIQAFLARADVKAQLGAIGIRPAAVGVYANALETDGRGRFTGAIEGRILTKHNRPASLPEHAVFIGDGDDEKVFRRVGKNGSVRFINWRRWGRHHIGRGFDTPAQPLV